MSPRSTNKGALFRSVPLGPPSITVNGPLGPSGWYTGPATVTVSPHPTGGAVAVTVNGQTATAPITLTADGAYEVVATTTPGGPSTSATVRVDAGAPRIEASRVPETTPSPEPVTVSLLGIDGGIGIDTITFSAAGALTRPPVTVPGPVAEVTVAALGRTTITATATDRLGRQSAPIQVVVDVAGTFDVDPPVVQCGPLPTQWHAANVTINCTASDAGSGLADPASGELLAVDIGGRWRRDRRGRNRVGQRVRRRRQLHQGRSVRPAEGRSSSADRPRCAAAAGRAAPPP